MARAVTLETPEFQQPVNITIPSLLARRSRVELKAMGKALRDKCPRISHAEWKPPRDRPDPVRLVLKADEGRHPDLLPLRHGRMVLSPFTFYRGSALAMAVDLAGTPATGVRVQCGGDSHLVNFRGLATPERQVIFAINDLDETLPAPWEWDLKRLAASFVIACRDNGLSESSRQGCGPQLCQVLPRAHGRVLRNEGAGPVVLRHRGRDADLRHRACRDPPPRDQGPGEGACEQHVRRPLPEAR